MGLIDEFNVVAYFIQIAPVVVVMGVVIRALWGENKRLNGEINKRDKDNLKTLEEISNVLNQVKEDGLVHLQHLKSHIDERITSIKDVIRDTSKNS